MAPCLAKDTQIGARGLAYGLTEVEDFSIRLLGPTDGGTECTQRTHVTGSPGNPAVHRRIAP
jgi:hypothetical protein